MRPSADWAPTEYSVECVGLCVSDNAVAYFEQLVVLHRTGLAGLVGLGECASRQGCPSLIDVISHGKRHLAMLQSRNGFVVCELGRLFKSCLFMLI